MVTIFSTLETAKSGLSVSQAALSVTTQNISNASTDGYTRQKAVISSVNTNITASKYNDGSVRVGSGATVSDVTQIRNTFLDTRYRTENSEKNKWDDLSDDLSQMEDILNEFSDTSSDSATGLSGQMSTLLSDIKKLQNSSDDTSIATTVRGDVQSVCEVVNSDVSQLDDLLTQIKGDLSITISGGDGSSSDGTAGVTATLDSIARLNKEIAAYEANGQTANELRDERNNLLDDLSSDFDITVSQQQNGMVTVALKNDTTGKMLIDGDNQVTGLKMNDSQTAVEWADGTDATVTGGTVEAALEMINGTGSGDTSAAYPEVGIPAILTKLDNFSTAFADSFNGVGDSGAADLLVTGSSTSPGTAAAGLGISSDWSSDSSLILSNYTGSDTASYIAQFADLFSQKGLVTESGVTYSGTLQDYTDSISLDVGNRESFVNQMKSTSDTIVSDLSTQRKSYSSVSINEEGVDLIKYQQAYNASARVITTINDMLDTLINQMGV